MKLNRPWSLVSGQSRRRRAIGLAITDNGRRTTILSAFTLIEIMVAIGIIAIILAIAIPSIYQQTRKEGMRKAVSDLIEACRQARERAILEGTTVELSVRVPPNGEINVRTTGGASGDGMDMEPMEPSGRGGGGSVFNAKFSDHITYVDAQSWEVADRATAQDEVIWKFYRDGTCDYLEIELRSDQGEVRIITTDVVTGIADVEVVR